MLPGSGFPREAPLGVAALLTCPAPFRRLLSQGAEHGDVAPSRSFSDRIDAAIAEAARLAGAVI